MTSSDTSASGTSASDSSSSSPLSALTLNSSEDGLRYLQGNYDVSADINDGKVFVSVQVLADSRDNEAGLAAFEQVMADLGVWIARAEAFLQDVYRNDPALLGGDDTFVLPQGVPVVEGPEVIFHSADEWSILFADGVFPICEPYGIMVNFQGDKVVDFTDLSSAEDD